jgi:uncharacterized protein with von Willebrand factor type A (vWA) domain
MTEDNGGSDGVLPRIRALVGARHSSLAAHLVGFARLLKLAGFDVTSGRVIDAARALVTIDVSRREDVRLALRACFVSTVEQTALFDELFNLHWSAAEQFDPSLGLEPEREAPPRLSNRLERGLVSLATEPSFVPGEENPAETYSAVDVLTTKDFSDYTDQDLRRARRMVRALAPKLATAMSRRPRPARSGGPVDLRRSIRRSVRHGGEVMDLVRTRRRVRKLRLVVLCDVSGSMDSYSRFMVQLLYVLQNELRGVSTFVFSTRLSEVTHLLKTRSFDEALREIGARVDAWSGGTSIGESLAAFNLVHARRCVSSRTVLLIISDGWDRGDTRQLVRAMQSFRRRAHSVIWLNPLLGHPGYRPLAKGMAAALPYVDHFLPVNNLDSLVRLARTLVRLARE